MNSFGRVFRVSMIGESHGSCVGVLIDGCPAGIPLSVEDFSADLTRRRSGAKGTTPRQETDIPIIRSGVFNGKSTGAPLLILFDNNDTKSTDYEKLRDTPRPGHADFVAVKKFGGFNDYRGGGHFSGRLTAAYVAAGVIAKKIIGSITVEAKILEIGGSSDIEAKIDEAVSEGDSVGGVIECRANGLPVGLGEPFFDSVESALAHAVFAIPAVKGIEFGSGFSSAKLKGSQMNDEILNVQGKTGTNNAGGINGGITNGNELIFRIAVKPTSSIKKEKQTVSLSTGENVSLSVAGRHDACIALRVPPVLEGATAVVLADLMLLAQESKRVH
jgi:chorismate synthase